MKGLSKADGYVTIMAKDPEEDHRHPGVGEAAGCHSTSTLPFFCVIHFFIVAMTAIGKVAETQRRKLCVTA